MTKLILEDETGKPRICPVCRNRAGQLWFDPNKNERNYTYENKEYLHINCKNKKVIKQ